MRQQVFRVAVIVGFIGCVWGASGWSSAQTSAADRAAAQALFDEGKRLMAEGAYKEACPKLQESQNLDPAFGTLFQLAECYGHTGRTASAWAAFVQVADTTRAAGQADRSQVASERAKALETKLCRLTILVPDAAQTAGLVVTRDGEPVGKGQWGTPVPVDPGSHIISAEAPEKEPWRAEVSVVKEGAVTTITVPSLVGAAADPMAIQATGLPPANNPSPPNADAYWEGVDSERSSTTRTYALITAGVGVVGLGVGTYYGLRANSEKKDSEAFCRQPTLCSAEGVALRDDAIESANISTAAFAVGSAALATGVVIWLLSGNSESGSASGERALQASAMAGNDGAGLVLRGVW